MEVRVGNGGEGGGGGRGRAAAGWKRWIRAAGR